MASETRSAGTGGNDATVGTDPWIFPGNVLTSDDVYATATTLAPPMTTQYLTGTNFGFSVPAGAIIEGIKAEFEAADANTDTVDSSIKIIKGGAIAGLEHSTGGAWPAGEVYREYGSSTDLWDLTWTATDINAADFGVGLSIRLVASTAAPRVDHIRITVYYTVVAELAPIFELHSHPPPRYWNNQFECLPF